MSETLRATPAQLERARLLYGEDDVQIDEDAVVSETEDGVWVQAWVWLPKPEDA